MRIASLGAVYLDINASHFPVPDDANELMNTETVGDSYKIVLGGSAINFARFCKALGNEVFFIGKTGSDDVSMLLSKLFEREGILAALTRSSGVQTNLNTNLTSQNNRSLMLSFGSANQSMSLEDILGQVEKHIADIDIFYLGGVFKLKTLLPSLEEILSFVKAHGKKIVIDHGRVVNSVTGVERNIMKKLVLQADYYLPSKDEFLDLWEVGSIGEGLKKLSRSPLLTVVKDAENGAYTLKGEILHISAFSVIPKNIIGAGDSFNSGFITALEEKQSIENVIRFANATAALKISQDHLPTYSKVSHLVDLPQ